MFNDRDSLILATLNNSEKLHSESFEYKSLFLSLITPDETNARFLPSIFIENEHARLFSERKMTKKQLIDLYDAQEKVIIGKGCIINCLKYGTNSWKKANHTVDSIIELGENISVSEMIQVPTLYPIDNSQYQILTGHRRFFAMIFIYGLDHAAQFKVYDAKPVLYKVKQFQENASREDLPQYGKLQAFLSAMLEIEGLDSARLKIGQKKLTVKEKAKNLGISMGAFDNYNVLTRYPEIIKAYANGLNASFLKVKKIILECEYNHKSEFNKKLINQSDKKIISEKILEKLSGKKQLVCKPVQFHIKNISSVNTLKKLLFTDVSKVTPGFDWDSLDWDDVDAVNKVLINLVDDISS
ncbi:hypothetical protein PCIT_a3841 [Pseudoalteromonas citrea]|uniref:ParB/Sulfiredoxin domain-containing protein n=2 Tax=Pseudoalteromonas citrea TaxID=43655 RepID=A0AAD4AGI7_9GAMM|nr:hypothetical protein [Pseudoalteromonas citrea]KAF7767753.1 hypothetical protein PCIT_a3841 [Pseudoalteromonas citrea]